jgi:hypothetical protein
LELLRGVEIIGDDGTKYFTVATVWSDGGLGSILLSKYLRVSATELAKQ